MRYQDEFLARFVDPTVCLPSLTFQLAMFPSVIVGDIAGIVKFCAARVLEHFWKPMRSISNSTRVMIEAKMF